MIVSKKYECTFVVFINIAMKVWAWLC